MGDFNWDVPPPAGKGSAQATETSRRWMRCHTEEGRQERATGLPLRCPSARARWLPSPCLRPLRAAFAGWDPRGGGCPWERTTREKDLQHLWFLSQVAFKDTAVPWLERAVGVG